MYNLPLLPYNHSFPPCIYNLPPYIHALTTYNCPLLPYNNGFPSYIRSHAAKKFCSF